MRRINPVFYRGDFRKKKFNKVTEKTLKQSKALKNIKKFNNLEALFADLGI